MREYSKRLIIYRTTINKKLRDEVDSLGIELIKSYKFKLKISEISQLLELSFDGFDDFINKESMKDLKVMLFKDAVCYIHNKQRKVLKYPMFLAYSKTDKNKIVEFECGNSNLKDRFL